MKHLKLFNQDSERLNFENSYKYQKPYTSLVDGNNGGGVTVHYNKEIKTIIKLTKENGDVISITNDMDDYRMNDIFEYNREYTTKMEVFSGVENNRYDYNHFKDWYRLRTIVIHEGVKTFPFNFTYDRYYAQINNLLIYGKNMNIFYHGDLQYLFKKLNSYLTIYVDESKVAELENYKYQNNLSYSVYSLDRYHDENL